MVKRVNYTVAQLLNAKAETGVSAAIFAQDYRNIVIQLTAAVNSSLTYKFQGALALANGSAPDFGAARTEANPWEYVEAVDLQDGSAIDGDTGVVISNTAVDVNIRLFEININCLDYVSIEITAYTDGALSASATLSTNA